jgi:hypothetical protein
MHGNMNVKIINDIYLVLPSFRKANIRLNPDRCGVNNFSIKLRILFPVTISLN